MDEVELEGFHEPCQQGQSSKEPGKRRICSSGTRFSHAIWSPDNARNNFTLQLHRTQHLLGCVRSGERGEMRETGTDWISRLNRTQQN